MDFDSLLKVGNRKWVNKVKICEENRFLEWCGEEDMDIVRSWSEHFTRKGVRHVVGKHLGGVSIWRMGMVSGPKPVPRTSRFNI